MPQNGTARNNPPGPDGQKSAASVDPWSADYKGVPIAEPRVWVLSDDRAGNVAQAVGVAEALAWPFEEKKIRYGLCGALPNLLRGASLFGLKESSRRDLVDPWPDVVIAAGRRTVPVARWIKKQSKEKSFLCQVMWPGSTGIKDFDLVAVPTHDTLSGVHPNVVRITGAPHRVTEAKLGIERAKWAPRFSNLPKPLLALVVGGSTKNRSFTMDMAQDLAAQVHRMAKDMGATLLVTTSRRTGIAQAEALLKGLPTPGHCHIWTPDGHAGENPYFGYLSNADAIVVTGDSVSMVSEACATDAAVYVYAPPALISPKHQRMIDHIYGADLAMPLGHPFQRRKRKHLNAAQDLAALIRAAMVEKLDLKS